MGVPPGCLGRRVEEVSKIVLSWVWQVGLSLGGLYRSVGRIRLRREV